MAAAWSRQPAEFMGGHLFEPQCFLSLCRVNPPDSQCPQACQNWMEAHGSEATTSWDAVQAAKKAVEAKQAGAKPEAQAPPAEPAQKKKARRKSQDSSPPAGRMCCMLGVGSFGV